MCKVIPFIEKEVTEKFFLSPFVSLCCDSSSTIRKVCAVNFSSFCEVLGVEITERSLLPAFFNLCNDEVWGVRKECANVFADVSKSVSPMIRKEILPHYFISLLNDESHYVELAAYHALGEVISTFASSSDNIEKPTEKSDYSLVQTNQNRITEADLRKSDLYCHETNSDLIRLSLDESDILHNNAIFFHNAKLDFLNTCKTELNTTKTVNLNCSSLDSLEKFNLFNNFQFWRTPLPEIEPELDLDMILSHDTTSTASQQSHVLFNRWLNEGISKAKTVYDQNVVPPELLASFISGMKKDDSLIMAMVAYNFCAVAYTLGKEHWSCIRDVYYALAHDKNETVRATVASFLHELAAILGSDIILSDLLPISLLMASDIDAVRVKLLTYLSRFLQHLRLKERKLFLPFIMELLEIDPVRNWRFRFTVVEQLIPCVFLFDLSAMDSHFRPITLSFINDRAAAVRKSAIKLLCVIIKFFLEHHGDNKNKVLSLLVDIENMSVSYKWLQRQQYVYICQELATEKSLSKELFIEKLVPNLLSLAFDTVPNVRLAVARCLCLTLFPLGYFLSIHKSHRQHLFDVLDALQSDNDWDVRYFFRLCKEDYAVFKEDMDALKSNRDLAL